MQFSFGNSDSYLKAITELLFKSNITEQQEQRNVEKWHFRGGKDYV